MRPACAVACLLTGLLSGQAVPNLEVRGRVIEPGINAGIAGVEVTLIEPPAAGANAEGRPFGKVFTTADGVYRFQPLRAGTYIVQVRKEGYQGANPTGQPGGADFSEFTEFPVELTTQRPSQEVNFYLVRPGEITGRVVDENRMPVAGLNVAARARADLASFDELASVTEADGSFSITDVPPGEYFVVLSDDAAAPQVMARFTEQDLTRTDDQYERSFWPGGSATLPASGLRVSSGAPATVGTIVARKVPYYRALTKFEGPCQAGQQITFAMANTSVAGNSFRALTATQFPCTAQVLARNLAPGTYTFALWIGQPPSTTQWGLANVQIDNRNVETTLTIQPSASISGRIVAASGAQAPRFAGLRITARPTLTFMPGPGAVTAAATGLFTIRNVAFPDHVISIQGLGPKSYVQELRYNGRQVEANTISVAGAGQLEFTIDDRAAAVKGTVTSENQPAAAGVVVALRWPQPRQLAPGSQYTAEIKGGEFEFPGLPPGEYRFFASAARDVNRLSADLVRNQFLSDSETLRVDRGDAKTLPLKLIR